MRALVIQEPGRAVITQVSLPTRRPGEALLGVRRIGL